QAVDIDGDLTISANAAFNAAGKAVELAGNWTSTGTFTHGNNTVTFNGIAQTISGATAFYDMIIGSSNQLDINSVAVTANAVTIQAGKKLRLDNASDSLTLSSSLFNYGTVEQAAGSVTINDAVNSESGVQNYSSGVYAISGGNLNIIKSFMNWGGTLNVSGTANISVGIYLYNVNNYDSVMNISGGTITCGNIPNYQGTINHTGGTITSNGYYREQDSEGGNYYGSGTAILKIFDYIRLMKAGTYFNNVEIIGSGSITSDSTQGMDVNGNFTINSGRSFTTNGKAMTVAGNWTNSGTYTHGNNTVTFDGTGTQVLIPGSSSFYNLIHSGSGILRVTTYNLTIAGALTQSNGTFDANGRAVTVTGLTTVSSGEYQSKSGYQTFNGGLTISGGTFTGSTGTVDVNGNLNLSGGILNAPSNLYIYGNWSKTGGTFNPGTGYVVFDNYSSTQTLDSGGASFFNINFYGYILRVVNNDLTVNSYLNIGGDTFDANGRAITVNGNVGINWCTYLAGSGAQTFNNLYLYDYANFTGSTGTVDVNGNFYMSSNAGTFTAPSGNFTVAGNWSVYGGTFVWGGNTVTFDSSSIDTEISSGGKSFNNLIFNGTGSWTLLNGCTVENSLILTNGMLSTDGYALKSGSYSQTGGTFNAGSSTITSYGDYSVTGGIYNAESSTLILDATNADSTFTGTGYAFNNVIFKNMSSSYDRTITLGAGNFIFNGNFYLYTADSKMITVDAATNNPDVVIYGDVGELTGSEDLIENGGFEDGMNGWTATVGMDGYGYNTFTADGGIYHSGSYSARSVGQDGPNDRILYQDVTLPDGSTYTLTFWVYYDTSTSDAMTLQVRDTDDNVLATLFSVNSAVPWTGGSYDLSAYAGSTIRIYFLASIWTAPCDVAVDDFSIPYTPSVIGAKALNMGSGEWTVKGNIDLTNIAVNAGTSHVTFNAADLDNTIKSAGQHLHDVTFDNAAGKWTLEDALNIDNDLVIQQGTLDANGKTITIGGNWTNNDNFISNDNTVIFDIALKASLITGNTDFFNFTCDTTGKHITFASGSTQGIYGTLTLTGAISNLIVLRPSGVAQWNINIQGDVDVSFVDMYGSNNIGDAATINTSRNTGNNTNWIFLPALLTWTGAVSDDWEDPANWDLGYVPNSTDYALIEDVTNDLKLYSDLTIYSIYINNGASLDINGFDLTVTGLFDNLGTLKLK
ncbi:MAG: carbohydrate binding domain-containing protein, partial [Candidatus Omnitrophota bacterium]